MMGTDPTFVSEAVAAAQALRAATQGRLAERSSTADDLDSLRRAVALGTGTELDDGEFADLCAQAVICAAATIRLAGETLQRPELQTWLLANANPVCRPVLEAAFLAPDRAQTYRIQNWRGTLFGDGDALAPPILNSVRLRPAREAAIYFYEQFLSQHDTRRRTRHGVFYTPRPVAAFIVEQVHRFLHDEFDLAGGLADTATWGQVAERWGSPMPRAVDAGAPFVTILDPALGTGVFLVAVIECIQRHLTREWETAGLGECEVAHRWSAYVVRDLLPRLTGLELMLPACALAHLQLAWTLAETGFDFVESAPINIHLTNTLAGPPAERPLFDTHDEPFADSRRAAAIAAYESPFTVVLGNPPFSGISQQQNRWITDLLRGRGPRRGDWADYYQADGQPLGERKLWLQDDYVKFLRYAHWQVETAGCGIVGLVTNHGYLDNPTFRGVRQQLMRTFPRIAVLDLHGNLKKKERAPDGGLDQSVFEIGQGTAIGLFRRPPPSWVGSLTRPAVPEVAHAELWGSAEQKLDALSQPSRVAFQPLEPDRPFYFFVPRLTAARAEYERGFRLPDIMPVNVTAPVTARDSFVIAFDEAELLARMSEFRDRTIPDDDIRRRYFTRTRSPRYRAGDTRGWKLSDARRRMADDPDWRQYVRRCWYRPFDQRAIYWVEWMIDWPRADIMQHLLAGPNLALIARRQMLPTQPCNYFWVTDGLTVDGLIRSDNRGGESVFPLYLYEPGTNARRANFSDEFVDAVQQAVGLDWVPDATGDGHWSFGPADLFHYIYAVFFSETYRRRYADMLRADFPRVPVPVGAEPFLRLREIGVRLVDRHLLRAGSGAPTAALPSVCSVAPGFPKYAGGRILLNATFGFPASPEVWNYQVGGHQVCRKWLKDRRGRTLSSAELAVYRRMLHCVGDTGRYADEADAAVATGKDGQEE